MTVASGRSRLRQLMAAGLVVAPGVSDPFTASLVEREGFAALYLGGNALGLSYAKGQPLVTLTETVDQASRILRTSELPLIVDAGSGFGAPPLVRRSVREIEVVGAAALHIDDQPYPKSPNYHRGRGGLAQLDEAVARIRIAREARRDDDLLLIARTDALRVTGSLEAAIARGRALAEAGADALMMLDLDPGSAEQVRRALPGLPLVWIGAVNGETPTESDLAAAGFAIALYPMNTIAAIADAVGGLWRGFRATGRPAQSPAFLAHWRHELAVIAGMSEYWAIEDALSAGASTEGEP